MVGVTSTGLPPLEKTKSGLSRGGNHFRPEPLSLPVTPDIGADSPASSSQIPLKNFVRGRKNGYGQKTLAYGAPEVVKKIYTGQLPMTYFNDICYGRRATPREFRYRSPTMDRDRELWEPKRVSREQARYVIRDIQDARFRKQKQLEKQSAEKERARTRRIENALLKESETVSRGLKAYLNKLDRQKEKYLAKVKPKVTEVTNGQQPQTQKTY